MRVAAGVLVLNAPPPQVSLRPLMPPDRWSLAAVYFASPINRPKLRLRASPPPNPPADAGMTMGSSRAVPPSIPTLFTSLYNSRAAACLLAKNLRRYYY